MNVAKGRVTSKNLYIYSVLVFLPDMIDLAAHKESSSLGHLQTVSLASVNMGLCCSMRH